MKIINNTTEKLADDLCVTIKKHSRVSMAAACFSVYAFEELKAQFGEAPWAALYKEVYRGKKASAEE